jgi:hypothetical protein
MKLSTALALGMAAGGLLVVVALRHRWKNQRIGSPSINLGYQEHTPKELASEHLLDLNTASHSDLVRLGIESEVVERILENRPYRNKLDLLSRMVIAEPVYDAIKHRIGIARATESIKVTG